MSTVESVSTAPVYQFEQLPHRLTLEDQARIGILQQFDVLFESKIFFLQLLIGHRQLFGQMLVFPFQLPVFQVLPDHLFQRDGLPGFCDVAMNVAVVNGIHEVFDLGVSGQNDADGLGIDFKGSAQQIHTPHARHSLIRDDGGHRVFLENRQGLFAALRLQDLKFIDKGASQFLQVGNLVINDQKPVMFLHGLVSCSLAARGNSTRNTLPFPFSLSTAMVPLCS